MKSEALNKLREADKSFHLHPFTNHNDMHRTGTRVIETAHGCFVVDETGRELLDGLAGLWCVNVGYGRKEIADAVHEQMKKLAYYTSFFNTTTEPAVMLAERLGKLAPKGLKHTIFSNSGSEANESALKLIRGYHKIKGQSQKSKILSRTFSYHGVGIATTSMTGLLSCYGPFDLPLPGFIHVPGPYRYAAQTELDDVAYGKWCIEETEKIVQREDPKTIAAIFVEPIQGAGGVIVPPEGYLKALRELARKYEILFVADEVITAFGRIGAWFASDLWNLDPDFITTAKGITSGYLPLGATIVSDAIADVLNTGGYLAHGFTYSGHPTPCAAALANIDILEKDKLLPRVTNDVGPYFQQKLAALKNHPAVGEIRGYGLIGAIELLPKDRKNAADQNKPLGLGVKMSELVRAEGAIVRGIRDLIALSPPLIITRPEIDQLFASIDRALPKLW